MVRGYDSIRQCSPDPYRQEALNIGMVLFCPELPRLTARFTQRRTTIEHLFGEQDWEFFEAGRAALESRRTGYLEDFPDRERSQSFTATRAGAFRLTLPRPVKAAEPSAELDSLFDRLVVSAVSPR